LADAVVAQSGERGERTGKFPRDHVRLSVRALMVLILITASGLGWVAYRARLQRQAVVAIVKGARPSGLPAAQEALGGLNGDARG
jgi:hypothetical protein